MHADARERRVLFTAAQRHAAAVYSVLDAMILQPLLRVGYALGKRFMVGIHAYSVHAARERAVQRGATAADGIKHTGSGYAPLRAGRERQVNHQVRKRRVGFTLILEDFGHVGGQCVYRRGLERTQQVPLQRAGHIQPGMAA